MEQAPLISQDQIQYLKNLGGDKLLKKMIHSFLNHTPQKVDLMKTAVLTLDYETLSTSAHFLSSSSGNLGATRLFNLTKEIEQLANDEKEHELLAKMDLFFITYDQVKSFFETMKLELSE